MRTPAESSSKPAIGASSPWLACGEVFLIVLVFFLFAGSPPPDVNEAHYLAKAKHYWNPAWCPGDHFLESADAHLVFNWTLGWLTLLLPLEGAAWVGRLLTWGLLAWAWQRLSVAVVPRRLFSVLTAGLFLLLIQHFHMAGEWVVGGVEAKGFAFVLVFLGMEAVIRHRWRLVWLLLGAASAFHVLVGGWSVIAAGFGWLVSGRERARLIPMLPAVAGGMILSLPGLLPGLALTWSADAATVREANDIYVFKRLSHHLVPHTFPPTDVKLPDVMVSNPPVYLRIVSIFILRHLFLLAVWAALFFAMRRSDNQRRLHRFVAGAVAIALVGGLIDLVTIPFPAVAASLLRFYWFRMSDALLPVGVALALIAWICRLENSRPAFSRWATAIVVFAITANLGAIVYERMADLRPLGVKQSNPVEADQRELARQQYDDWRGVCAWVQENTEPTTRFFTPRLQQTFKWNAGRSEVVSRKDIPQDAASIVEWWRRRGEVFPMWPGPHDERETWMLPEWRIAELGQKYGASFIVVDRRRGARPLSFPRVYPNRFERNDSYVVYRLPPPAVRQEQNAKNP